MSAPDSDVTRVNEEIRARQRELNYQTPEPIRVLFILLEGKPHTVEALTTAAGITSHGLRVALEMACVLGVLEHDANRDFSKQLFRILDKAQAEAAVKPYRPFLDGTVARAMALAKEKARQQFQTPAGMKLGRGG